MIKISEKWEERTEAAGTIWPMGGTFDPIMYRDMEVVIRNYIDNRSGKTALAKKDRERLVLALFEEEGERWRALRVARKIITKEEEAQPLPLKLEPPPYKPTNMHPLITDNVEFKGEVTLDEGDNECNTQGRVSGDPGTEVSGCSTSIQSPLILQSRGKLRRARRGKKAPDTLPGNYPILVKGQQVQYQPWGSQDLEGVISSSPTYITGRQNGLEHLKSSQWES